LQSAKSRRACAVCTKFFKNLAFQLPEKLSGKTSKPTTEYLLTFHFTLMKTKLSSLLITVLIACLEASQNAHAVTPPPDGGYPHGNTAEGENALFSLTRGRFNSAIGWRTLLNNTGGNFNTALGAAALSNNANASENTATGAAALSNNAALLNSGGNRNTANGASALFNNTTGSRNTAMGNRALFNNTTGSDNIALGFSAGSSVTTADNVICIGTDGTDVNNSCFIGNIFGATSAGGSAVFINSNGKLGTATSSQRFKEEIKPMERASEVLFALKPVTFHYKKEIDPQGIPQFGLVAEDVEGINPDLVVRDKEGKVNSVRYEAINAMLLNEFLKEHRKVEELQATVVRQQKGMEALAAQLKDQATQIQRVSASGSPIMRHLFSSIHTCRAVACESW
jgi:Chaperone of endosialidase